MAVHALHLGIAYELEEVAEDEWHWSFVPASGIAQAGKVVGEAEWAMVVVRRAIEGWHALNERSEAA